MGNPSPGGSDVWVLSVPSVSSPFDRIRCIIRCTTGKRALAVSPVKPPVKPWWISIALLIVFMIFSLFDVPPSPPSKGSVEGVAAGVLSVALGSTFSDSKTGVFIISCNLARSSGLNLFAALLLLP